MDNESFVMYQSIYNQYLNIKKYRDIGLACEFMESIMNYGFYNETPPKDSELWMLGIETHFINIQKAIDKYKNASKGGRKKKDVDLDLVHERMNQGIPKTKIAKEINVSVDTIDRRLKGEAESAKPQNNKAEKEIEEVKTAKPQNNKADIINFEESAESAKPQYINKNT